jgi:hypothetical protein
MMTSRAAPLRTVTSNLPSTSGNSNRVASSSSISSSSGTTGTGTVIIKTEDIHEHDVLCGRGEDVYCHAGNEYFRKFVDERKTVYLKTIIKREKRLIAQDVVELIHLRSPRGRFLDKVKPPDGASSKGKGPKKKSSRSKLNKVDLGWVEICNDKAREKASQALRENAPALKKELFSSNANGQNNTNKGSASEKEHKSQHQVARRRDPRVAHMLRGEKAPINSTRVSEAAFDSNKEVTPAQEEEEKSALCPALLQVLSCDSLESLRQSCHDAGPLLQEQDILFSSEELQSEEASQDLCAEQRICSKRRLSSVVSPESSRQCVSFLKSTTQASRSSRSPSIKTGCFDEKIHSSSTRTKPQTSSTRQKTHHVGSPLKKRWLPSDYVFATGTVTGLGCTRSTITATAPAASLTLTKQELSVLCDLGKLRHERRQSASKSSSAQACVNASAALLAEDTERCLSSPPLSPLLVVSPIPYHPEMFGPKEEEHLVEERRKKYQGNHNYNADEPMIMGGDGELLLKPDQDEQMGGQPLAQLEVLGDGAPHFSPVARSRKLGAASDCVHSVSAACKSTMDTFDSLSLSFDDDAKCISLSPKKNYAPRSGSMGGRTHSWPFVA